ncbi:hypothetical protein [Streptomyces sp. Ac-502]|uniref:hypothetical protein n=1 Tax=Streptomyces sp. Ac-502 TaxID=3342801 RepID=UPI0038622D7F
MTARLTASQITDNQLDALYARLARAEAAPDGPQETLSARETGREGSGGAGLVRAAERPSEGRPARSVGERAAAAGPRRPSGGHEGAPQSPDAPECPEPRERAAGARTGLQPLLARLITDAAHHTRCAEYGREFGRPADLIAIHDGFAAGFSSAACYVAELIATGALQWRGGHHVPADDEAAAARVAGQLAATGPERARQILRAVRGEAGKACCGSRTGHYPGCPANT